MQVSGRELLLFRGRDIYEYQFKVYVIYTVIMHRSKDYHIGSNWVINSTPVFRRNLLRTHSPRMQGW